MGLGQGLAGNGGLSSSVVIGGSTPSGQNPVRASDVIEGLSVIGYGHSYLNVAANVAQRRYFERIAQRIAAASSTNNGVAGYQSYDVGNFAHGTLTAATPRGTVAGSWTPAALAGGIVIVDCARNDAGWDGASGGLGQLGFQNALDGLIRLIRSQSATQDSNAAFAYGAGWSSFSNTAISGGSSHFTSTNAAFVTITTPSGTDFDLIVVGQGTAGSNFKVSVDGTDITATLAAAGYPTSTKNQGYFAKQTTAAWSNMAIPLRGLSNATHTVVLTQNDTGGQQLFVARLLKVATTPPTIVIPKIAQLSAAAYSGNYSGASPSWATDQTYNSLIDTTVARFGAVSTIGTGVQATADQSILTVDPNALGWNPATMLSSFSNLHPNDLGMACYADALAYALNLLTARNGLVTL